MKRLLFSHLLFLLVCPVLSLPLSGTYFIGPEREFSTIQSAMNTLMANGVSGPVNLLIEPGTYHEQITLESISGSSLSNPITIRSSTNKQNDVVISFTNTSAQNYVILLNGADFITFRDLTIESTGSVYGRVFEFRNGSERNLVENVVLNGVPTTSVSTDFAVVYGDQASIGTNNNSRFFSFKDCQFNNGSYGFYYKAYAIGGVRADSISIVNSVFSNQSFTGIELTNQKYPTLKSNIIMAESVSSLTWYGINLGQCQVTMDVSSNTIFAGSTTSTTLYGIVLNNLSTTSGTTYACINNMVSLSSNGVTYGLNFYNARGLIIVHNTVLIHTGTSIPAVGSAAMFLYGTLTSLVILNNLLINQTQQPALLYNSSAVLSSAFSDCNFNNWFSEGSILMNVSSQSFSSESLDDWNTQTGFDANSVSFSPVFLTTTDLHLAGLSIGDSRLGGLAGYQTLDIDQEPRSSSKPYMGADEAVIPLTGTLAGVIPVGNNTGFNSVSQALSELVSRGFSGTVTLSVAPGNYNEQLLVTSSLATTEANQIIIESATGIAEDVTIISDPSSSQNYVIQIDGTDYLTLRNLTLQSTGTDAGRIIDFRNGSDNLTVENVTFSAPVTASTSTDFAAIYCDQSVLGSNNSMNLLIKNSRFINGSYGIYYKGYATGGVRVEKTTIEECTFTSQSKTAVALNSHQNTIISGNTIISPDQTPSSWYGISLSQTRPNFLVDGNKVTISISGSGTAYGISLDNQGTSTGIAYRCINNMISISGGGDCYGVQLYNTKNLLFAHNTILIHPGESEPTINSAAIYIYSSVSSLTLVNNLFISNGEFPSLLYASSSALSTSLSSCNFNNWYSEGSTLMNAPGVSLSSSSLDTWRAETGFDQQSVSFFPEFISTTDLHLTGGSVGNDLLTGTFSDVTTDADNDVRHETWPYMGADEIPDFPLPVEIQSISGVRNGKSVFLTWTTKTEINHFGWEVHILVLPPHISQISKLPESRGTSWKVAGFVNGNGTTTSENTYYFSSTLAESDISDRVIYFRLKQIDLSGEISFTDAIKLDQLPTGFTPLGNYPNPFNPVTTILFNAEYAADASLAIYDMLGRLIEEKKIALSAGINRFPTGNLNWASGKYIYRISGPGFSKIGTMILIR